MSEPIKTLNGATLSIGMAMTLRVALESFAFFLREEGLGDDEHGRTMTSSYLARINELREIIYSEVHS